MNGINFIKHTYPKVRLNNIPIVIRQQLPHHPLRRLTQLHIQLHILLDVFLQYGILVDKILLEVLLVDSQQTDVGDWLEGNGLGLDVGRHVREVEVGSALVEGEGSHVLHHGEVVIVDGDGERLLRADTRRCHAHHQDHR